MVSDASKQAALAIDFIVIGAGISGLATAIALRRVGHRVLVIEKDTDFDKESGGCRMPPNFSKILFHWGLEDLVRTIGVKSEAVSMHIQETGELIGKHVWAEEVLKETGGEFIFGKMGDLRRMLYRVASSCGVDFKLASIASSIDTSNHSVTLLSGEVLTADVIVGADGTAGVSRRVLMEENDEDFEPEEVRMNMYCAVIPRSSMLQEPELKEMYERDQTTLFTWFGNTHAALAFKLGGPTYDFGLYVYGPRDGNEGNWEDEAPIKSLQALLEPCEARLRLLGRLTTFSACVPVREDPPLEEWIAGRLVGVGASVHPIPPGSIQDCAMAFEDGCVLAKIFSHLQRPDQINSFLNAYQDVRQPRINIVHSREVGIIHYMTMEPCDFQQTRDDTMRNKRDAGMNALDAVGDMEESPEWAEIKEVFAYDCENEADNWWVEWGLLRERAIQSNLDTGSFFHGVQVTQVVA